MATRAGDFKFGLERQDCRRPIRGRVGMDEAATKGSFVSDLNIPNVRRQLGQQGAFIKQQCRRFDLEMGGHRADGDAAILFSDVSQVSDAAQVHDRFWLGQAQFHRGQKTVTAGQNF